MSRRLFFSYAPEDEASRERLEKHLSLLRWQGVINTWHRRSIPAGEEEDPAWRSALADAEIILLLLSADYLASRWENEFALLLERHRGGEAQVLVVLLRAVDRTEASLSQFPLIPRGGRSIAAFQDEDEAWAEVAEAIRSIAQGSPPSKPSVSLSRALVRRLLMELLDADDFDAFCSDHFQDIRRRFTSGMQQVQKVTILLEHADATAIFHHLHAEHPAQVDAWRKKVG